MNFLNSCMVLITNDQQQIELNKWIKGIGWNVHFSNSGPCSLIANTTQSQALWIDIEEQRTRKIFARDFIDCGENIELFKALAAINDENDREQWFVADSWIRFRRSKSGVQTESGALEVISGHWFKVIIPSRNNIMAKWQKVLPMLHKATSCEIIEHFNLQSNVRQQK